MYQSADSLYGVTPEFSEKRLNKLNSNLNS